MLNVVATLQQRCGNVDVGTTLIFDRATTLWQRQQRRCDNVVTTSLCQLGKFVINFLKKSGRFDKPLISLNQWFYVLLFLFLPICLLHVVVGVVVFLLENKCNFAAYNWLKISC